MRLIYKDKQKRIVEKQEKIEFSSFSSYHLIVITARAKSEKQLEQQVTDDEDLTVRIGNRTFPKLKSERLKDSPVAFSSFLPWSSPTKIGTETFTVDLPQELHYIEFDADRMPTLNRLIIDFGKMSTTPDGIPTVDNPKWTGSFYDDTEVILLSRAIYGEAGGEFKEAKVAVGWAIRNRMEDTQQRWGNTYHDVILEPFQYEPFNDSNSDRFKRITNPPLDNTLEKKAWLDSYQAAELVFFCKETDPTEAANHFYVPSNQPKPDWVDKEKFTVQIGATRFYKL